MIALGKYNTLQIERSTSVGLFLVDGEGNEVLLPNKYVPETYEIDQKIEIFCYLDHEERPIATTIHPLIFRNGFAVLRVTEVNKIGAFLDWGLEKNLLVPYREQQHKMVAGNRYLVHCYLDEKSFRLVASGKLDKFLDQENISVTEGEEVSLIVHRRTDLGWEVIINEKHKGLIFFDDVFKKITYGDQLKGYVKRVRTDKKIDITLQPIGLKALEPAAKLIYELLQARGGYLGLHDKSDPEDIKSVLQMSKKTFKKGIGTLFKSRKITIKADGIYLNS